MNKNETYEFTEEQLKDCYHFSLPKIDKFQVTYNGDKYLDHGEWTTGFRGGEYIEIKLDNQTIIRCLIKKKVGQDVWDGSAKQQLDISGDCRTKKLP